MDPRHPEIAVSRIKELMKQYDRVESDMKKATTSAKLAQLEREGGLVVQEIFLVAPRIHEAMMQTSRQRRHDLTHGLVEKPVETEQSIRAATHEERAKALDIAVEEEKDFERLKGILAEAEKKFKGKSAKNKETGVVYNYLRFMTVNPYPVDNIKYGTAVSIGDGKEEISFYNDEVTEFLNNYEPVEEEKPVEKLKDDAEFKKAIDDSIEVVEKAKDIVEKALEDTKKKKTSKKKKAE